MWPGLPRYSAVFTIPSCCWHIVSSGPREIAPPRHVTSSHSGRRGRLEGRRPDPARSRTRGFRRRHDRQRPSRTRPGTSASACLGRPRRDVARPPRVQRVSPTARTFRPPRVAVHRALRRKRPPRRPRPRRRRLHHQAVQPARTGPRFHYDAGAKITIEMLLHHKSGVPDVLEVPALWKNPGAVRTAADWYAVIRDQPLNFEPGTREEYSNGGFVLLGMIIEKVSGEDYYAYIQRHVCEPAAMTQSDHYDRGHLPANTPTPYSRHADDLAGGQSHELAEARALPIPLGRGPAAGGGYSTAGDLVRFAQAFRSGTLLGRDATSASGGGVTAALPFAASAQSHSRDRICAIAFARPYPPRRIHTSVSAQTYSHVRIRTSVSAHSLH